MKSRPNDVLKKRMQTKFHKMQETIHMVTYAAKTCVDYWVPLSSCNIWSQCWAFVRVVWVAVVVSFSRGFTRTLQLQIAMSASVNFWPSEQMHDIHIAPVIASAGWLFPPRQHTLQYVTLLDALRAYAFSS